MRDIITIKYSDAPGAIPSPSSLEPGELALNRSQGLLFYKDVDGTVKPIGDATGAVVRPGGPYIEPGIGVAGAEFFVDATVVRVHPDFVPDNPTPGTQAISGLVNFSTNFPITGASGVATFPNQLVNVTTLKAQLLQEHSNTSAVGLTSGSIYQYNGSTLWEPVSYLDGGTF